MSRYTQYFSQNNVSSELAVGISSIATTIQVNENQGNLRGNKFPVLGTLENFNSDGSVAKREIVKVVSRTGDAFNVVRAFAPCPLKDGDTSPAQVASTFSAGDKFSIYIPSEILEAVSDAINDLYNNGNDRLFLKKTTGLGFEITPGNVRFETGEAYYPGGTGVVVDNSMNYIMLDSSFNIIVNQEELFDVQNISIAEVKAVNGEITEITTRKIDGIAGRMGGGGDPVYGDGSDGDLVISENTILNAGQQYQFSNLTICPGATVSFSGTGGAKIRVANLFINEGIIDTTDIDVEAYEYRDSTSFCMICNCAYGGFEYGKGGIGGCALCYANCSVATSYCGGTGGKACECPGPGGICCNGAGGTGSSNYGAPGGIGYMCGGGGGRGGGGNSSSTYGKNGCSGNGYNGGDGGEGGFINYALIGGGGGGGGGFYTGKGGNGGSYRGGGTYCYNQGANCPFWLNCPTGGQGGNGGILGNGGNGGGCCVYEGGRGGDGGDGVCGGKGGIGGCGCAVYQYGESLGYNGGTGGKGYYGGDGGDGGSYCIYCGNYQVVCCRRRTKKGGDGGIGGQGIVPGKGGNGGNVIPRAIDACFQACINGQIIGGTGGQGGTGCSRLHSLNIKAKCFCNTGCILSVGAVGGQGGNGGNIPYGQSNLVSVAKGGRGGTGGQGGQGGMIQIITNEVLERGCISVAGGVGGQGGCGGYNCYNDPNKGPDGTQGPQGQSGTLYFFLLEG